MAFGKEGVVYKAFRQFFLHIQSLGRRGEALIDTCMSMNSL